MGKEQSFSFKNSKDILFKCLFAALSPFLICLAYCAIRGYSFFNLYLPNSYNNDVLFYYKQMEAVMSYGHPQGYFGFNESHALYGGFAAWNPILFIPWILFCLIFGCNYMSLIISNIVFFSFALVIFVLLTKIDWSGLAFGLVLLALYPAFSIHLMNGLAETNVAATLIIFFGLGIHISNNGYKKGDVVWMFILASLLTLCRPFMIVLFLLPCIYYIKCRGKIGALISAVVVALSTSGYFVYSHFFSSPYVTPLFNGKLLVELFTGRFGDFLRDLKPLIKDLLAFLTGAFDYGLTAGTQYVVSGVCIIAVIIVMIIRKDKKILPVYLTFALTALALFAANIFLLNKVNEGGRHLWAFSVAGILLCTAMEKKEKYVFSGIVLVLMIVFLSRGALIPTDYDIPTPNEELRETVDALSKTFEEQGVGVTEGSPWDNTLIWASVEYKQLYSVPAGMSINFCFDSYAMENMEALKSKYIAVDLGGFVEEKCLELGYEEIARTSTFAIFKRY